MKKEIIINIPVYKMKVYVWLCPVTTAQEWYKKTWYYGEGYEITFMSGGGKTLSVKGVDPIIWVDSELPRNELIGALAHEVLHVVHHSLDERGSLMRSPDNAEHYAYLLEYCLVQVLNKLPKAK